MKDKLFSPPIIIAPNRSLPFKMMGNACGVTLGVVLGHRKNNFFHPIYYTSKTLNYAQKITH